MDRPRSLRARAGGAPRPLRKREIDARGLQLSGAIRRQNVIIDGWGGDKPLTAIVNRIEPSAFTKSSALGIEEQRVNAIAHVITWSGRPLKVPSTAVFRHGDSWAVFRVHGRRAGLQPIAVGHRSADEVEITRGLSAGDMVIVHPSDQVRDGVRVTPSR